MLSLSKRQTRFLSFANDGNNSIGYWCPENWAKLDDGWPESVEEQGLLLLVWRHNFTNNIWKMCYRQSRREVARQNGEKCKTIVCIANTFTHRRFYTQKFLHTEAFTHKPCCNSRTFSDISGCSEPRVTTYRRQARYKSRTNSCADQLHAFTNKRNTSLQLKLAKSCGFTKS